MAGGWKEGAIRNSLRSTCWSRIEMRTNDARRERKKATNAALYLKNVASGKQKLYQSNNRDKRREKSILKKLPESKRHLLESALKMLSAEIKAGRKSSPRLIESSIFKCVREHERSLAASASGLSDDGNAATSTEESANSGIDAPDAHRTVADGNAGRSDALAALAEVAAAAEPIEAEAGQPALPPLPQQAAQQVTMPAPVPPQEPEQGNAIVGEDDIDDDDYDGNIFDAGLDSDGPDDNDAGGGLTMAPEEEKDDAAAEEEEVAARAATTNAIAFCCGCRSAWTAGTWTPRSAPCGFCARWP